MEVPEGVTAASLVDAMGRRHAHRCHVLDLRAPDGRVVWGPAATLDFRPKRADLAPRSFGALFYDAVGDEPAGKVLVMAGAGYADASIGGGTKLSRVANHGLAGVVTDARLRDFEELRAAGVAAWCRGETVRWGGDAIMPFAADVPVTLGPAGAGVLVMPGDYVWADAAATVVVPAADVAWVLEEARRIEAEDAEWIRKIRREDPEEVRRAGSAEA